MNRIGVSSGVERLASARKRRAPIVVAACGLALVVLIAATADRWLPFPGRWLVVNDPLAPADVIVVLSGNMLPRVRAAARLYREHYAPRVIVSGGNTTDEVFELLTGERASELELISRVMNRLGVPDASISRFEGMKSTRDEAAALRKYVATHQLRKAIVVTSHLHSRRARWIFRRILTDTHLEIAMVEADQADVDPNNWWRDPDGGLWVLNEYLKFGYYVTHY